MKMYIENTKRDQADEKGEEECTRRKTRTLTNEITPNNRDLIQNICLENRDRAQEQSSGNSNTSSPGDQSWLVLGNNFRGEAGEDLCERSEGSESGWGGEGERSSESKRMGRRCRADRKGRGGIYR